MTAPIAPFLGQIHHNDCIDLMTTMPDASIDVIFADPPYFLQLPGDLWRPNNTHVDGVSDAWDQFSDFDEYDHFTRTWLDSCRRILKPTGTIWVSGTYHNIFRVGTIMQDLGYWILNTIAWFKPNAMPNFKGTRLKNDVEFVIWAKRDEQARYTFNHHQVKMYNVGKQLGSMWQINTCGGAERLRDENGKKLHSTQKPEALLERIIVASSKPGDIVLDPFSGSGTTAAVAKRLRRHWMGVELEEKYVWASRKRLDQVVPEPEDSAIITDALRERPPRVPFKRLLECGYLSVGQPLFLDAPEQQAEITPDAKVRLNGSKGSIHGLGAKLKGTPTCNGWMHWFYVNEHGERQMLDVLRQRYREEVMD